MDKVLKLISWIIIFFIAIAFGVPYYFTRSSEGCAACHSMKPYYLSWKKSFHSIAASNCLECHVRPGLLNRLLFQVYFWREIKAEVLGEDIKPSGVSLPENQSCVKAGCHALNRKLSVNRDIKIDHASHVVRFKIKCVECHPGTVHAGVRGIGKALPPMKLCFRCHEQQKEKCSYCHIKRFTMGNYSPHDD